MFRVTKIHKTRCQMKTIITSILAAITLVFNPVVSLVSSTAYAAPAIVPVGADLIGELLVALGILSGNDTDGYTWDWRTDTSIGRDLYTKDIFGNVVPKLKTNEKVSESDLSPLLGTVIPEDVYNYDGNTFSVTGSSSAVTASDIFLTAKSLATTSYFMPVNIKAVQAPTGIMADGQIGTCAFSPSSVGTSDYYFAYAENSSGVYIRPVAFNLPFSNSSITLNFSRNSIDYGRTETLSFDTGIGKYVAINFTSTDNYSFCDSLPPTSYKMCSRAFIEPWIYVSGSMPSGTVYQGTITNVTAFTCLVTSGVPALSLNASVENLGNSIVQVKPSNNDDDNNNGSSPPAPQSPNSWEIWKGIDDLIDFISTGNVTNGGTTFDEFVNNNYNYVDVDVDINVPDEINNNVNISGGLDINGKGDVDITIHEDVSLPTGGDGSGFYNPDAVDAIAALTTNNPAVHVIKGLFEAIDPALVGIFSVGVSLLVVLGLWKLIRG